MGGFVSPLTPAQQARRQAAHRLARAVELKPGRWRRRPGDPAGVRRDIHGRPYRMGPVTHRGMRRERTPDGDKYRPVDHAPQVPAEDVEPWAEHVYDARVMCSTCQSADLAAIVANEPRPWLYTATMVLAGIVLDDLHHAAGHRPWPAPTRFGPR